MDKMPRTPSEAGLIGVALKRKKEYKNTHKNQLVDPSKMFRMLNKMKLKGNKHYQFYEDFTTYHERCQETDPLGYDVVFTAMDDPGGRINIMDSNAKEVHDEILEEEEVNIKIEEEME